MGFLSNYLSIRFLDILILKFVASIFSSFYSFLPFNFASFFFSIDGVQVDFLILFSEFFPNFRLGFGYVFVCFVSVKCKWNPISSSFNRGK